MRRSGLLEGSNSQRMTVSGARGGRTWGVEVLSVAADRDSFADPSNELVRRSAAQSLRARAAQGVEVGTCDAAVCWKAATVSE